MALNQAQQNDLEHLIDVSTLSDVLFALEVIAAEKSEHLQVNWQDRVAAKQWQKASNRIETCRVLVERQGL